MSEYDNKEFSDIIIKGKLLDFYSVMDKKFEILPHISDLKIRAYGKDLNELFRNSLIGMFKGIDPILTNEKVEREVDIRSEDTELLLVAFLSDAISLSDIYKESYFDADFDILESGHVKGVVRGSKILGFQGGEIKAVTHHGLKIEKINNNWQADILFDL